MWGADGSFGLCEQVEQLGGSKKVPVLNLRPTS